MSSDEDGFSHGSDTEVEDRDSEVEDREFTIDIPEKYLTDHQCLLEESPPFQALVAPPSPEEMKEVDQHINQPEVEQRSGKCDCILQAGKKKGQRCGRKLKPGQTRCGLHLRTCISEEPIQVVEPPEQLVDEPIQVVEVLEPVASRCPCVYQAGKKKGQVCGRKTKPGLGVCGVHTKTCIQPAVVEVEEEIVVVEAAPDRCPCVYQAGKKKGQVCGRKTKPGLGVCGVHTKTCIQPAVAEFDEIVIQEANSPASIQVHEQSPRHVEVVELSPRQVEAQQWAVHRVDEADLDLILSNIDIPDRELPNRDLRQEIYRAVGLA
jgi:hypothetical protein